MKRSSHLKRSLGLLATLALAPSGAQATISTALQMQLGNPSGATADSSNHSHYLLQRTVDAIDYSDTYGQSTWVSWDLTGPDIGTAGRSSSFYQDTALPTTFYRLVTGDYTNSGYDRGHMCPSYDRTDTSANNLLVFYMSNIIPQTPDNNQGVWQSFEAYCQSQAQSGNELLITSGPSLFTGSRIQPSGKASIPGYTWKIAVIVPPGSGTALSRITTATRVIALKIPNIAGVRNDPWTNYVTSVNQLQADTGYTFFTALPASVASVLRAKVDGAVTTSISSFTPSSGPVGTSVTISGAGFTSASAVSFNGTAASFTVNSSSQITTTVPSGATSGTISVTAPGGVATSASSFTVTSGGGGSGGVRISQVYGGGGNSGATYKNDFIELYNGGSTAVNLATYAVQYASSTGSSWAATNLSGTLQPGHYYLIQEAAGTGGTTNLPTPQATGSISMSASAGKVALTNTQTLLTTSNPVGSSAVVDFVGYGTANAYEGSGAAPTPSATTSDLRAGAGATDTNDNAADFTAGSVTPRNN
ncbi:DNA/RNA non-specific endonuclease [Luteolibacter ambystomatis]|uniref:DNA/RNA non-specific endonuclease n=1 Tax=Luteolibacter ambystomatis TaxID=2824561 RepID=A0A975PGU2_9BACT|nr:DNA/RNA non-specific endonuclease [Luteolibacter ambystomatis]QUE52930.1 DNA/RNA non-specific endonuclease [Luteolibacter ambystomatis]